MKMWLVGWSLMMIMLLWGYRIVVSYRHSGSNREAVERMVWISGLELEGVSG